MQRHKIFPVGNIFAGWILGRSTLRPYPSQLICHHSFFKEKRPEDGKPEGRIAAGSWTRGNKGSIEESASERRGTATLTTGSRLCRRIFYADTYNTEGLKAPGYLFSRLPDDFAQPSPLANQKTCSSVLLSNLTTHFSLLTSHYSSISRQRFL